MNSLDHSSQRRWEVALVLIVLALLAGCATVEPDARFPDVQKTLTGRLPQDANWSRNAEQRASASDAVHRLLQNELSADTAVQIALLNNHDLQSNYESLGIAQADLVEAGLLENPVFSYTYYSGSRGIHRRGIDRPGLRERAQPVCPKEGRTGRGRPRRSRNGPARIGPRMAGQDAILRRGRRLRKRWTSYGNRDGNRCRCGTCASVSTRQEI